MRLTCEDLSLRLPGFNLPIINYLNEENHQLRYVLKNRKSGDVYLVIVFSLILQQEDGQTKDGHGIDEKEGVEDEQ